MKKPPTKRMPPAKRIDVTRLEYEDLLAIVERNGEAIKELRKDMAIQLRRAAEIQYELDKLKTGVPLAVDRTEPPSVAQHRSRPL